MGFEVTHIIVAQHDSLGVTRCSRGVDECAALIGSQGANHSVQGLVRHVLPQLHELRPLETCEPMVRLIL